MIAADGKLLGIITREDALKKAQQLGLDLIEIAPQAKPPVARILDFQKFRYEESKKERAARKGSDTTLKELWLSPRIANHDLMVRLKRAEEFLNEGHKVKLTVKFLGREMSHPELGHKVLQKIIDFLREKIIVERESRFEGRRLSVIIGKSRGEKL